MKHTALVAFALSLFSATSAQSGVIEDFSGTPATRWEYFSDQVMGGVSEGRVDVTGSGLRLTGTVSTANNGGFIQARLPVDGLTRDTQAIKLTVKGNGQKYYMHIRTRGMVLPWRFYQAEFQTTGGVQEVRLPLSSFRPEGGQGGSVTPDKIKSIAVVAYGANYTADLLVTRIETD